MTTDNKVSALVEKNEELIDKIVSAPSKATPGKKLSSSKSTSSVKKSAKPAGTKRVQSPKSSAPATEAKPAKKEAKNCTPPSAPASSYADVVKSSSTAKLVPAPKVKAAMQKLAPKKDEKPKPATKADTEKKK